MRNRVAALLILLAWPLLAESVVAEEVKPKTDFAFDAASIAPRAPDDQSVARCFRRQITLADLQAASLPLDAAAVSQLQGEILRSLLDFVAEREKVTVQPEEVRDFYRCVLGKRLAASELSGDLFRNTKTAVGARFVRTWKVDRLLYERYGGTVIFQQGNPQEPVGAYRQLLEEAERAKVFEIYDMATREAFYHYFTRDHGVFETKPEDVRFKEPWWLSIVE